MKKLIVILSILFIAYTMGFASNVQKVPKIPVVVLKLDTKTYKDNDTFVIDSTKLRQLKSFIADSTDITKKTACLESELTTLKQEILNDKRSIISSKILLFVIAVLIMAILVFIIIDKKKRRDEILYTLTGKESNNDSHRLPEWENKIIEKAVEKANQKKPDDSKQDSTKSKLDSTIKDLQERIALLEDSKKTLPDDLSSQVEEQSKAVLSVPSSKTLYAEAIIDNSLHRITEQPNNDTIFELLLLKPTDKTADLMIFTDAYKRVLKNADFIDGCEKQRINKSPINLEIEKGEAQLQDNGKWQVTKKANVKFV